VSPASSWFACGAVTLVDLLRFLMLLHNCCCLAFLKTNRCVGLGLSLSFPAQFSHLVWDPLTMGQGLCATVPVSPAPPPSPKRGLPQPQRATPAPSPHLIFRAPSAVWFHLRSILSGCMLIATGGVHLA
jgi:hypothetical protein